MLYYYRMAENENYRLFLAEYSKAAPRLRAFLRQLLPSWNDVDEVLQETSLVLWKKFPTYEQGTHFFAWACMIARFEVLKYRRAKSRDRHIFSDSLLTVMAEEYQDQEDKLTEKRKLLKFCLAKLEEQKRKLLMASYSREITIKDLAIQTGVTPGSLYKMLDRLRVQLIKCVNANRKGQRDGAI